MRPILSMAKVAFFPQAWTWRIMNNEGEKNVVVVPFLKKNVFLNSNYVPPSHGAQNSEIKYFPTSLVCEKQ